MVTLAAASGWKAREHGAILPLHTWHTRAEIEGLPYGWRDAYYTGVIVGGRFARHCPPTEEPDAGETMGVTARGRSGA